jgi:hypothetical protein
MRESWTVLRASTIALLPANFMLSSPFPPKCSQDDIRAWAPKVRPGGILAGHDYLDAKEVGGWVKYKDGSVSHSTKAVRSAVAEFAESTNRQLVSTYGDLWEGKPFPSWFMRM